jgi:hypothetical protein
MDKNKLEQCSMEEILNSLSDEELKELFFDIFDIEITIRKGELKCYRYYV